MANCDRVLVRQYNIQPPGGGVAETLKVTFFMPQESSGGDYEATATIECSFFAKNITTFGIDEVQAFFLLRSPILAYLSAKGSEGYCIYWEASGEIDFTDL